MIYYNELQVGAGPWCMQDQRGQWQVGWESRGTAASGAVEDGNGGGSQKPGMGV